MYPTVRPLRFCGDRNINVLSTLIEFDGFLILYTYLSIVI